MLVCLVLCFTIMSFSILVSCILGHLHTDQSIAIPSMLLQIPSCLDWVVQRLLQKEVEEPFQRQVPLARLAKLDPHLGQERGRWAATVGLEHKLGQLLGGQSAVLILVKGLENVRQGGLELGGEGLGRVEERGAVGHGRAVAVQESLDLVCQFCFVFEYNKVGVRWVRTKIACLLSDSSTVEKKKKIIIIITVDMKPYQRWARSWDRPCFQSRAMTTRPPVR